MFLLICSFCFLGKKNGIFEGVSFFRWSWKSLCSALVSRSDAGHVDVCPSEQWMYFCLTLISSVLSDVCLVLFMGCWGFFFLLMIDWFLFF